MKIQGAGDRHFGLSFAKNMSEIRKYREGWAG